MDENITKKLDICFAVTQTEEPISKGKSENTHFLESFINPRSIAFFGANGNLIANIASQQLINLFDNSYKGHIYPIHPKLDKVFDIPAYKSVKDLPETPDLAFIVVRAEIVPELFKELAQRGTKNVILVTAGFRETGKRDAEENLKKLANELGIRFFGPNCIGILNTHCKFSEEDSAQKCILNCTSINYHQAPGNISMISHSGTFASHIFMTADDRILDMSKSFSLGNEANIDIVDVMEYLENDHETDVILLYIEEIKRGRKFMEVAKRITPKKPIIALYCGGTEGGSKAVGSHTGSLGGNDNIYNAVFKQSGITRVYSVEEMMDTALLFSKMIPLGVIPKSNRLVITTTSGGPGATMADRASRLGFNMPQFSPELKNKIKEHLVEIANCMNPLDFTFNLNSSVYYNKIPKLLATSGEFDCCLTYGSFGPAYFNYSSVGKILMQNPETEKAAKAYVDILQASIDDAKRMMKKYKFPTAYINPLGNKDEIFVYLNKKGFPTYQLDHQAVNAMNNLVKYGQYLNRFKEQKEEQVRNKNIL